MKLRKFTHIGFVLLLLISGGFLGFQIIRYLTTATPPGPFVDVAGVNQLDSISEFIEPIDQRECMELAKAIRSHIDHQDSGTVSRDGRKHRLLMELIERRVNLILNPDYDDYVRHVGDLLGADGNTVIRGSMFDDRQLWENFAKTYRFAALVPDQTTITGPTEFPCGRQSSGGRRISMSDPGYYGSQRLVENGAEIQIVVLPMLLSPLGGDPPKVFTIYVSLNFVWDAARGQWLPLETCVQDPTGTHEGLPVLWI